LAHFQIPLLPRYHAAVANWLLHLRSCTTCSQSLIDTFTAIMGIDRIVAFFPSLSTVTKLSGLFVAGPDFQWNSNFDAIQYWRLRRYFRHIFKVSCFHSKLPALFVAGPDFQWKSNRLCTSTTILDTANCYHVSFGFQSPSNQ
jgi:hypothetical protein